MKLSSLAILILLTTTALPAFAADSCAAIQTSKDAKVEANAIDAKPSETKSLDGKEVTVEAANKGKNDKNGIKAATSDKAPVPTVAPVLNYSPSVTTSSTVEAKAAPVETTSKASGGTTPAVTAVKGNETSAKASNDVSQASKESSTTKGNEPKTK